MEATQRSKPSGCEAGAESTARARHPRRWTALTASVVAGAALVISGAAPAQASPFTIANTGGQGVQLYTTPSTATPMADNHFTEGATVDIICQTWSPDAVGPRGNHIFDQVFLAPMDPQHMPWIPDAYVSGTAPANQFTPGVPRCDNGGQSPAVDQAIAWARGYLGQNAYDLLCLVFVHDAYAAAGMDIGRSYSAQTFAQEHQAQLRTDGTPPAGALVFWWGDSYNPDGHVALSLGDGTAISTTERSNHGVHIMDIAERNQTKPYAGWMTVA